MDREMFRVALRVLARLNTGLEISPRDASLLRRNTGQSDLCVLATEIAKNYLIQPKKPKQTRKSA